MWKMNVAVNKGHMVKNQSPSLDSKNRASDGLEVYFRSVKVGKCQQAQSSGAEGVERV